MFTATVIVIFSIPVSFSNVVIYLHTTSNLVSVTADITLSFLFLRRLLEKRLEGTLLAVISQNQIEWLRIICSLLGCICVFVFRLIALMVPSFSVVYGYVGYLYPLITLQMFSNYLVMTTKVTREILKTDLKVTAVLDGKNTRTLESPHYGE